MAVFQTNIDPNSIVNFESYSLKEWVKRTRQQYFKVEHVNFEPYSLKKWIKRTRQQSVILRRINVSSCDSSGGSDIKFYWS